MVQVCIIGLGLIGGSLGLALRRVRWKGRRLFTVHGSSRSASTLRVAKRRGAVDRVSTSLSLAVSSADIVVLATPVQVMPALTKKILPHLKRNAVLTDVGSVKSSVRDQIKKSLGRRRDVQFVGAHPIAGSEKAGIEHAHKDLFEGAVCVITADKSSSLAVRQVTRLWQSAGARPLVLSADKHDEILSMTSHLPHLLAFALFSQVRQAASRNKNVRKMTAGSFRDMTRIAGSDAEVWAGIIQSNRGQIQKSWKKFQADVQGLLKSSEGALVKKIASLSSDRHKWKQN